MSRVANNPVQLPSGVEIKVDGQDLSVKGSKGTLAMSIAEGVQVSQDDNALTIAYDESAKAIAGTTRALVANMVKGVSEGWEKKLVLNGSLSLSLSLLLFIHSFFLSFFTFFFLSFFSCFLCFFSFFFPPSIYVLLKWSISA